MAEREKPRKSTRLYKQLFHQIKTGLAILHLESRVDPRSLRLIAANPAGRKAAGVVAEDYEGKRLADTAPKLFETGIPQACAEVVRSGQARDLGQVELGDKGIGGALFAVKAHPLPGDCAAVLFEDITERKQAEEALAKNVEWLRSVFENSAIGIGLANLDFKFVGANRAYHEILGYTEKGLRKISFMDITYEDDRRRNWDLIMELLEGRRSEFQFEKRCRRKDGKLIWVRDTVSLVPGSERVPQLIMAITEDITERKRAQEALEQAANRFKLVTLATQDALYDWDLVSHEIWRNQNYQQMFGAAEWSSDSENWWADRLHPEDRERALTAQDAALASGSNVFSPEYRLRRPDGSYADIAERSLIVRDAQGQAVRMIGALTDITERRRAEEALRPSEQRYWDLFENATDIVFTTNIQGNITSVNRAGEQSSGYARAELTCMNVLQILAPEYVEGWRRVLEGLAAGREPGISEWEIVAKDGHRVRLEANLRQVRRKGELAEVQGIARDITERKRAEEALAESEERFRSLAENATVGIYRTTPDGRILMANPTLVRLLGFDSFEELASRNLELEGFATGYPRSAFRQQVEREGELKGFESAWERRDGTVLFVRESARVVRAGDGQVLHYDGIVEDVTERKQAEDALKESEARFRAIFENSAIGIALVDMHGHPVERNPALQKMLGYDETEPAQMAFNEFTHPADAQADWDLFTQLVEGKRDQYQLEKRFYQKGGEAVWGQLTVSLVRNQNGEPQYAIGMVEDISERKRAEEALRQLSGRLLRLQDEERRRIARELHDNTAQSLAALAINLSVVKDAAPDLNPRVRTCLSESLELAERCSREIRTLSYLLHPPLLDEAGLGSALRWFVDGYTQRTGIHVDLEIPPELTRLPGDIELALYRVVQEALTNIHLHSGSQKAHVRLKCGPDQAELTVADEGRGLLSEGMERGGRQGAKLGVGIPGMRERIRQLEGQLEILADSNGTTLRVIVPLRKDQNEQASHPDRG
jgi:PAS domain S-box-containing protein